MSPAEAAAASLPASPAATTLVKKKAGGASEVRERAAAVRTRRLMKELKEIQRLQNSRTDPVFTVRNCACGYALWVWHLDMSSNLSFKNTVGSI